MDFCTTCGERLNKYTGFCTNCNSRVAKAKKNITSAPKTRIDERNVHSKATRTRNKGKKTRVGWMIGLLVVLFVSFFIIKEFTNHQPKTEVAATKTVVQPINKQTVKNTESGKDNNTTKESLKPSSSNYILPDSDKKFLNQEDIASLSKEELRLARNEIYARHGYVFKSADLQKYFSSKSWYHAEPSYHNSLSKVEIKNAELLSARENQL